MKTPKFVLLIGATTFVLGASVLAHEPKEHMEDAQEPNCSGMNDMDHASMDREDPVMQAMMQKCMKGMHQSDDADGDGTDVGHEKPDEKDEKQSPAEHQHQ